MTDETDLHAQVVAAQKAEAVADLATLMAFQANADVAQFTVAGFIAAFASLAPTLSDPDRQRAAGDCYGQLSATLSQFGALIQSTQAAAN